MTALQRVVSYAGGASALARTLNVSHQAVHKWIKRGGVSADRAAQLCDLYGVPAAEFLRPELRRLLAVSDVASANADII